MLPTLSLFLLSLFSLAQEAPGGEQADTATAPELTPPAESAAREVLSNAQTHLYDVVGAGLESLSYEVPIRMADPEGETTPLGTVTVRWTPPLRPEISVLTSDSLPAALEQQSVAIAFQLEAQGRQTLRFIDNQIFTGLLEAYTPTLQDTSDTGLSQVHFDPKEAGEGRPELDWFFDPDGVPLRFSMAFVQGGMTVNLSYEHEWEAASETDASLVLKRLTVVQESGPMRSTVTTTLQHEQLDGLTMLTGFVETTSSPSGQPAANAVQLGELDVRARETGDG